MTAHRPHQECGGALCGRLHAEVGFLQREGELVGLPALFDHILPASHLLCGLFVAGLTLDLRDGGGIDS